MDRRSTAEWELRVGEQVRALRIADDVDQRELARLANVSVGAVQNLELGRGSTLRTLVRVVRALNRTEWLDTLDPAGSAVSPLEQLRAERGEPSRRRRVSRGDRT